MRQRKFPAVCLACALEMAAYNGAMPIDLSTIDPAELLPLPEVPESCGPRNDEERRIFELVRKGIESGPGIEYPNAEAFAAEFRAQIPRPQ
jgi:hypothetical protein